MMSINQSGLVISMMIIFSLLTICCDHKSIDKKEYKPIDKSEHKPIDKGPYNAEWSNGRSLYANNCSGCHMGFYKDSIFKDYVMSIKSLDNNDKLNNLANILTDSVHYKQGFPKFSNIEIDHIIYFIETPDRKGYVQ